MGSELVRIFARWTVGRTHVQRRPVPAKVEHVRLFFMQPVVQRRPGGSNTLPVGADLCPQPPPRAQQFCNMIDCPVEWKTGEWSQVTQFRVSRSLSLVNASLLTGPGHTSVALMGIE